MIKVYDSPTVNPKLGKGEIDIIKQDIIAARNLLNRMLDMAASNGITVELSLSPISTVAACRFGIKNYYLVETDV